MTSTPDPTGGAAASDPAGRDREAELSAALDRVEARIDAACRAAGRARESVRLLPVTKYFPAADVEILYRLGRREFGESKAREAATKVAEVATVHHLPRPRWHMIGRVQRNKAKSVVRWADTVDSVDSERLVRALDAATGAARDAGVRTDRLEVLLQVSLDRDPDRGGVAPGDLAALAEQVERTPNLRLAGLMAIAPLDTDPDTAFAELARLRQGLLRRHPEATELSAGMSGDVEAAVRHGSTCVRVGTDVMGRRPITSE